MEKEIQIQFRLVDLSQLQFATLTNKWPEGEMQISNQINFSSETEQRTVRCVAHFEYKKNDITQLLISVQSTFEFSKESWSAMYNLQGDEWVLPVGLLQHLADTTIGATRGILAVRSEEAGFPRVMLPMMAAAQFIRNNLSLKRVKPSGIPIPISAGKA
jgi:hypothetical protein